jgi:lipid II:glycine glycyltransferase (peptidoglycan interpeptide bridge formation enzyme)
MEVIRVRVDQMSRLSIRQSKGWAKFLEGLGWKIKIINGIYIFHLKTPLGRVVKIQKPSEFEQKDLEEIENFCREIKAMFVKIEPTNKKNEEMLKENGFKRSKFPLTPPSCQYINLQKDEEELYDDLSKSAKYSVRRSKREGDYVKFVKNPNDEALDRMHEVCVVTGKRGKFYVPPQKEMVLKRDAFGEKFHIAEVYDKKDRLLGAKFYLGEDNFVAYLQGGTTDLGRSSKGGYLLLWESILYLKREGYTVFDLEGVDDDRFPLFTKEWGGFSHFKEKFGGEIVRFPPPYIKYYSPVLKFMSRFYELPL